MRRSTESKNAFFVAALAAALLLNGCAVSTAPGTSASVQRDVFFAGGRYVGEKGKDVMQGAMYVEHLRPSKVTQKYPLVLIHGAAQTAVNWITTPDGRPGWAQYFLDQGYEIYVVDQPMRGRSAWHPGIDGALGNFPVSSIEMLFTASEALGKWPQAHLHSQWPGTGPNKGRQGDPAFDQFYASQVEYVSSNAESQKAVKASTAALLDKIGAAVLVTHSQSGPFGWLIADARPKLVKGIVAIEPAGPPIQTGPAFGNRKQAAWGLTEIPISYSPAIEQASELRVEEQAMPDGPGLQPCWLQTEPARQLTTLIGIPILLLTTEASYHAQYDQCTSHWLTQAGVRHDFVRLENVGIHGNGHMVMLEKNNLDVASMISGWIAEHVR